MSHEREFHANTNFWVGWVVYLSVIFVLPLAMVLYGVC